MTNSSTARLMTVVGLLLFISPARGWAGNLPLMPPKAAARDSALPTWSGGTLTELQHGQPEREPYQRTTGTLQGNGGWEQTVPPARRLVDEPDVLVPIYALRGRARWCTAPQEFVFCDHWMSADASMPQPGQSHRSSPAAWRMCSCRLR